MPTVNDESGVSPNKIRSFSRPMTIQTSLSLTHSTPDDYALLPTPLKEGIEEIADPCQGVAVVPRFEHLEDLTGLLD